jgi:hypothetical protein
VTCVLPAATISTPATGAPAAITRHAITDGGVWAIAADKDKRRTRTRMTVDGDNSPYVDDTSSP